MRKAQTSLEYLVLIAVGVAVAAIVSYMALGYFSTQQNEFSINSCRTAASTCKINLAADPTSSCDFCEGACKAANGSEIFPAIVNCCKQGRTEMLYSGTLGCAPTCKDGTFYEQCSINTPDFYCDSSGNLVEDCTLYNCCSPGESCNTQTKECYVPPAPPCTTPNTCVGTAPWYCTGDLRLIKNCTACPCSRSNTLACCDDYTRGYIVWTLVCLQDGGCDFEPEYFCTTPCPEGQYCLGIRCSRYY